MRVPTDKEIEEAKEYLRQRLDAELSMRTNLQIVMIEAAKQIIDISYRYKISPELFRFSANRQLQEEVDAIILSLLEIIEDYTYTLAVATHEDNKAKPSHNVQENMLTGFQRRLKRPLPPDYY